MINFFRGAQQIDGNYWGALALSPVVGLIQLALGLVLIGLGLGSQVRFVHYHQGQLLDNCPSQVVFHRSGDLDRDHFADRHGPIDDDQPIHFRRATIFTGAAGSVVTSEGWCIC